MRRIFYICYVRHHHHHHQPAVYQLIRARISCNLSGSTFSLNSIIDNLDVVAHNSSVVYNSPPRHPQTWHLSSSISTLYFGFPVIEAAYPALTILIRWRLLNFPKTNVLQLMKLTFFFFGFLKLEVVLKFDGVVLAGFQMEHLIIILVWLWKISLGYGQFFVSRSPNSQNSYFLYSFVCLFT